MTEKQIPKWILIVSGIFAILEILVSLALCFSPETTLETVDLDAKGVDYLIYMWAVRQFGLGIIFAYATWKRSNPMLTIAYLFLLVMFIGDLLIGIQQKQNSLVLAAIIMSIISLLMLSALHKRR